MTLRLRLASGWRRSNSRQEQLAGKQKYQAEAAGRSSRHKQQAGSPHLKIRAGVGLQAVSRPIEAGEVGGLRQQALQPRKHRRHACLVGCQPMRQVYVATDLLQSAGQ
jgi:hypothetical protein